MLLLAQSRPTGLLYVACMAASSLTSSLFAKHKTAYAVHPIVFHATVAFSLSA